MLVHNYEKFRHIGEEKLCFQSSNSTSDEDATYNSTSDEDATYNSTSDEDATYNSTSDEDATRHDNILLPVSYIIE